MAEPREDNRNEGYYYRLKSYMDIHIRQEYPKELIQPESKPESYVLSSISAKGLSE